MPHETLEAIAAATSASIHPEPHEARARTGWRDLAGGAGTRLVRAGGLLFFLAVMAFFAVNVPSFVSPANIGLILSQSAVLGILGFGLTLVLITGGSDVIAGGIDLSWPARSGFRPPFSPCSTRPASRTLPAWRPRSASASSSAWSMRLPWSGSGSCLCWRRWPP